MKTILIVEDDEHIGSALAIRMKHAGYHTLRASDGAAGLAQALDKKPDLIITDIKMPVGNGLSLAYRIQESGLHIPMIFITASREPGLREKSQALGGKAFFEKPYPPIELMAKVMEILEMPPSASPASPGATASASAPPPPLPDPQRQTILVIEEDRALAAALVARLQSAGYEAIMAHQAIPAVNLAICLRPHLVVLDTSMPTEDGFSIAREIRAAVPSTTPFVLLTHSQQTSFFRKAADIEAVETVEKPYQPEVLLAAIRRALHGPTANLPPPSTSGLIDGYAPCL